MTQSASDLATVLHLLEGLTLTPSEASKVLAVLNISAFASDTQKTTAPVDGATCGSAVKTESSIAATNNSVSPSVIGVGHTTPASIPDLPTVVAEVSGQVRFQKTYKGFTFEVPSDDSDGPFYLITKGHRVGIIDDWGVASDSVQNVSGAAYRRVTSLHTGLVRMLRAIDDKVAKVVVKK